MSNDVRSRDSLGKLVQYVFSYPTRQTGWTFEKYVEKQDIRYFSYGRHALYEALKTAGIGKGDVVLLPSFICRDLLSSIHATGASPIYYDVDESLRLSLPQESLPTAQAILAVNYFGFPQDMDPFLDYCQRTGAVLIEDNAHGFLSRDEQGTILGTRGDFGVFSLRKTIPTPNGAALLLNAKGKGWTLPHQLSPSNEPLPNSIKVKRIIGRLVPFTGVRLPVLLTTLGRKMRKFRTGHEIAPTSPDAERTLPGNPAPCSELEEILSMVDHGRETDWRRRLYLALEDPIREAGGHAVFDHLPEFTVPYGFPFRGEGESLDRIRTMLTKLGLECYPWPDLPEEIGPVAPKHYKTVWNVRFIW